MNREIKFRVWNQKRKIMYSWEDLTHMEVQDMCQSIFAPFDHEIVMQYTGLKDKNGKEIYEGDIVIYNDDLYIVDFGYAGFKLLDKNGIQQQFQNDFGNIEVIGNIYENPELLNNNK